jgi:flagellar hook assembly protein FlgD
MPSASSVEKKQSNLLDQVQAKTADRFKKDKTGKSFEDTRMDSTKRAADRYKKFDTNKAEKSFDEMIDFVIKCTLASAKNIDPTSEDSGSKSSEMLGTATAMATVGAAKQQVAKMNEMLEAIKNPGYNALELQGKEVSYDSSKRFDGTNPVNFKYNVNYPEKYKDASVSTIIKVVDSDGKIVYQTKGNGKLGDHNFDWNGCDKKGKKMSAGTYSIEVEGVGFATINGQKVPFHVDATSLKTAVVESVEMQNGVATKLILSNGESIDKSQVVRAKDISKSKNAVELSPDLIGNVIELDLTKAQSIGGDIEVYYDNHIQNPGKATIKISDSKGNLVKTFESDKIKTKGYGTIPFSRTGIESGNYTVEIVVENKDTGASETLSKTPVNLLVKGINYKDNLAITIDKDDNENSFKAYNINAVVQDFSPLKLRANNYTGKVVKYDDSELIYTGPGTFGPKVFAKKSDRDGATISHEELRIYDQNNVEVAKLEARYNPFAQLHEDSVAAMRIYMANPDDGADVFAAAYDNPALSPEDIIRANRYIDEQLASGVYKFKDEFNANLFKEGLRLLEFPKWDGKFTSGGEAQAGQVFTTRRATIHALNDGGVLGENPYHMGNSGVKLGYVKNKEIFLDLENGMTIKESKLDD